MWLILSTVLHPLYYYDTNLSQWIQWDKWWSNNDIMTVLRPWCKNFFYSTVQISTKFFQLLGGRGIVYAIGHPEFMEAVFDRFVDLWMDGSICRKELLCPPEFHIALISNEQHHHQSECNDVLWWQVMQLTIPISPLLQRTGNHCHQTGGYGLTPLPLCAWIRLGYSINPTWEKGTEHSVGWQKLGPKHDGPCGQLPTC